ncbi:5'-nucleotidase [uncultured Sneathiella sp.]|uniref:5'-nucleotidase n=1 Tax=uncultured Sneathiella sp. TaxID=879315 RepID=UPI0025993D8B|nr:5'-nucleotidase [uncultured Sneathiella sp.]
MAYPIDRKLVIAVSSSALFDLTEANGIFERQGVKAYKGYQVRNLDVPLDKGVAFPFIERFLQINEAFPERQPVEVVLLSKNSALTGNRVFKSIKHYGLNISRAAFLEGKSPYKYIPAFNVSLFLSANRDDVLNAISEGYPAGIVLPNNASINPESGELRIAFDFDGVIADDGAEIVYSKTKNLSDYHAHEEENSHLPLGRGLLADLFMKLAFMQKLEDRKFQKDPTYQKIIRTSIVTARNAPAHERMINTLENWGGVGANETFFLGGMSKERILSVLKPHIFFDDQTSHLEFDTENTALVHIPFGIANSKSEK